MPYGDGHKLEKLGWTTRGQRGTYQEISKSKLCVDHDYQRTGINNMRVLKIARNWSWVSFGVIVIVRRPDGTYWVVDGQHRLLGARKRRDRGQLWQGWRPHLRPRRHPSSERQTQDPSHRNLNGTDMTTDVKLRFDYTSLAGGVATEVARRTREIKHLTRRAAEDIVRIGEELAAVKAALPHGQFGPWLRVEFAWSEDTAQRMMRVATAFKNRTVRDLEFSPTALYLLSSDDVPEAARQEAVETAKAGTPVTKAAAREIVAKHKPERKANDRRNGEAEASVALDGETLPMLPETPPADPAAAFYEVDPDDEEDDRPTLDDAASEFDALVRELGVYKSKVRRLAEQNPAGAWLDPSRLDEFDRRLTAVQAVLKAAKPHAVCGYCGGETCDQCRKTGFLPYAAAEAAPQV